jgi:tetratricopeptide (TPR) repeat protein
LKIRLFVTVAGIAFAMAASQSLAGGKDDLAAAQVADQRGDRATAIALYTNALGSGLLTENEQAIAYRGRALNEREQRQFDKAIADQTEAIKRTPNEATAFVERGSTYAYIGRNDAALADFTAAIGLEPNDVTALTDRGAILIGQRDYAHALTDLNAAVAAEPNNVDAILNRAAALRGLGDKDGAIVDFGTVARLRPDDAIAYYERANTYRDKGDTARSIADYNTAIRLRPDYVDAFNDRGLTYQLSGQYPKALGDFETAIRLAPNDPDAYFNRAKLYRNLGQYDDAIADYNLLISLSPRFPPAYNGRAYANFHAGRFDAAANDFGRSLVLAPAQPYPVLWLHLARLRTHRPDAEEFAANVKAIAGTGWPAPIAVYLTHSITSAALLTAAARGDSATRSDRLCDANFFLGEEALAKNQKATARRFFLEGKRRCMNASPSYTGAVAELKHR